MVESLTFGDGAWGQNAEQASKRAFLWNGRTVEPREDEKARRRRRRRRRRRTKRHPRKTSKEEEEDL